MPITFRFAPDREIHYLNWKFQESHRFATMVGFASALLPVCMWASDWVNDPVHAYALLGRRLLMGGVLLFYPIAILADMRKTLLPWFLYAVAMATEVLFLLHLTEVQGGLNHGMASFMYWFLLPAFLGVPLSVQANLAGSLSAALLPNFLVLAGLATGFDLVRFNMLIWPTCLIVIFATISMDQFFRRLYLSRMEAEQALERERATIRALEEAITRVKQLSGLIPICAHCKKIRDDQGYWNQVEVYIREHSEADFSHSICPDCTRSLYPDFQPPY